MCNESSFDIASICFQQSGWLTLSHRLLLTCIQGSRRRTLAFHVHLIRSLITLSDNHRAASTTATHRLCHTEFLNLPVSFLFLNVLTSCFTSCLTLADLILKRSCCDFFTLAYINPFISTRWEICNFIFVWQIKGSVFCAFRNPVFVYFFSFSKILCYLGVMLF